MFKLVENNNAKKYYVGATFVNRQGCVFKIIGKIDPKCVNGNRAKFLIEFQDKYKTRQIESGFMIGKKKVCNPYFPSFFNKGYVGIGRYTKEHEFFEDWKEMLAVAYYEKHDQYNGVPVEESLLCFQNFVKYKENLWTN